MSMMMYTIILLRYLAMAAPLRREWMLISLASKPITSLTMVAMAYRCFARAVLDMNRTGVMAIRIMFTVYLASYRGNP
jgi:hypothetical protein